MVKRFGAGQVGIQQASSKFRSGAIIKQPISKKQIIEFQQKQKEKKLRLMK